MTSIFGYYFPIYFDTSQARVNLIHNIDISVRRPVPTRAVPGRRDILLHDIIRSFLNQPISTRTRPLSHTPRMTYHNIHIKPAGNMPGNMTMKRPHARIRRIDLHDYITQRLQKLHVPPLRVSRIHNGTAVPLPYPFGQNIHVVSVQVHRMCCGRWVRYDEADCGVAAGVVDVPFRVEGVGCVSCFGQ